MKKYILIPLLFLMISFVGKSQAPTGFPITTSSGWIRYGWLQNDSGYIPAHRDTLFTPNPRFYGTTVFWQHAGVDTAYWFWSGATTGQKWFKQLSGTFPTSTTYYNSNVGSGFRLAVPNTNNIKTIAAGTGISLDSSTSNVITVTNSSPATNAWVYDGNPVSSVRSIGTTTNFGLKFLINSTQSGYLDVVHTNTSLGVVSMFNNTTGSNNVAFGESSLQSNTTGNSNSAFGYSALNFNTIGINNTGLGYGALSVAMNGVGNSAVGYSSGSSNTSGQHNSYFGDSTGIGITTGSNNTIIGARVTGLSSSLANNVILADGAGNQWANWNNSGAMQFNGGGFGTANYLLQSNGTSSSPTWVNPSSIVTATPTLQQVTTAGANTTDTITTSNIKLSTLPPYSLMRNIQNSFGGTDSVVVAAGVIRGDASGGAGSFITWSFLGDATQHSKLYFTSVAGVATGGIRVSYPTTQRVVSFIAAPDETLSSEGMVMGATVAVDHADIFAYLPTENGGNITGAGGTTWTKSNKISAWSFDYNSTTGLTRFNASDLVDVTDGDYEAIQLTYSGANPYLIKRIYSGLSSYNVGFYLTDILGNPVMGNLSSTDNVTITLKPKMSLANGYQVAGNNYEASIWTALSNIWIIAVFKK